MRRINGDLPNVQRAIAERKPEHVIPSCPNRTFHNAIDWILQTTNEREYPVNYRFRRKPINNIKNTIMYVHCVAFHSVGYIIQIH